MLERGSSLGLGHSFLPPTLRQASGAPPGAGGGASRPASLVTAQSSLEEQAGSLGRRGCGRGALGACHQGAGGAQEVKLQGVAWAGAALQPLGAPQVLLTPGSGLAGLKDGDSPPGVSPSFSPQSRTAELRNWRAVRDTRRYRHRYPVRSCPAPWHLRSPPSTEPSRLPRTRPPGRRGRRPWALPLPASASSPSQAATVPALSAALRPHTPGPAGSPLVHGRPCPLCPESQAALGCLWGQTQAGEVGRDTSQCWPTLARSGSEADVDPTGEGPGEACGVSGSHGMSGGFWPRADTPSPGNTPV